jgi:hypothetical protein
MGLYPTSAIFAPVSSVIGSPLFLLILEFSVNFFKRFASRSHLTNTRPSSHTSFSLIVTPHLAFKRHEHIRYLNELDIFKGEVDYGVYVSPPTRVPLVACRRGVGGTESPTRVQESPCGDPVTGGSGAGYVRRLSHCHSGICTSLECDGGARSIGISEAFSGDTVLHREDPSSGWLEVAFKAGEALSSEMQGRDIKYRVGNFSTAMPMQSIPSI